MVSASEIKEHLAKFLDQQIDLDAFEDWLVQSTWNVHQSRSAAAESLTFAIEESLSEFSSHHISDVELRNELRDLIHHDNQQFVVMEAPVSEVRVISAPARLLSATA